jgi:tetratricopeptide (TPR) repeat protein
VDREGRVCAGAQGLDEASRLSPDGKNEEIYRFRGWTRLEMEDFDGAIADFTKAVSIEPRDIVSLGNRGLAFLRNAEFRKAIVDADQAIKLDKSFAAAWFIRGQAWSGLGEVKRAIADLDEYVRLDPKESGYVFRGAVHRELGQRKEAIADFREAVRLNPSGFASQANLACVLAASDEATKKEREEAISLARTACLRTEWKAGECLQILAIVYAELGQFDEAIDWQTTAVELASERDVKAKREQVLEGFKAKRTFRQSLFTLK